MIGTLVAPRPAVHGMGAVPVAEQQRWAGVDGMVVHARSWVDDAVPAECPVVLVHGLGVASRMCRPVARALAVRRHVHAPDLPGFGESTKPERVLGVVDLADALAAWMRELGIAHAVVAGTSLGSQIAAETALRHPELCRLVVLGSPTVDAHRRTWRSQLVRWQREQATQSFRMRALQVSDYRRCGIGRAVRTFDRALRHPIEDTVAALDQPVLVCWGTRDPLLSRAWVDELVARARDGRLAVLPGALHALSHENPLEFCRAITSFVADRS
jgi:2-hydroxy-6-oxonona-2,4-dienedioate hydrolase